MVDDPTSRMSPEDQAAWRWVLEWEARRQRSAFRELIPGTWRERADRARTKVRDAGATARERTPGAEQFAAAFARAMEGLAETAGKVGAATVSPRRVIEAYRDGGHDVTALVDIRHLDLADIRDTKRRLGLKYVLTSAAQGAGTGFLASGGTAVAAGTTAATAGAAAAPGIAVVVSAMAGDALSTVVASNRAVAHIAAYYGYDVDDPAERVLALGVLSVGLASDAGKAAAYRELNGVVRALAQRQTWQQLRQNQVTKIIETVFGQLGHTLTKKKLGTAVPVVGVAVGAGLNAHALSRVVDAAEHFYTRRYLCEKYGIGPDDDPDAVDDGLVEIMEAEIVDDDPDDGPGLTAGG